MPASVPKQSYSRREVCRLLEIKERQLRNWERQDLIPHAETYSFPDLIALRTLEKLRRDRVPGVRIRTALAALHDKLRDVADPLRELKIFADGKKVAVHVGGSTMEPVTGQLLLDFDQTELAKLMAFPDKTGSSSARGPSPERRREAEGWFEKGLDLEQRGAPVEEVIAAYRRAIELDPGSAGALVNLGTIYFHLRSWPDAEACYRQALEADPQYALAHFNLGNMFDEVGDRSQALFHYLAALRLNPNYADAHYNLALLYQSSGQLLRAVRHWKAYLKLDSVSCWAVIARQELEKLRRATVVPGPKSHDERTRDTAPDRA